MTRGDWVTFASELAARLEPGESKTLTVDEIIAQTKTRDHLVHTRGFWRSNQQGDKEYQTFVRVNLEISFDPDETGRPVERVTFRKLAS